MKLVSYIRIGRPRVGRLVDGGIVELEASTPHGRAGLRQLIARCALAEIAAETEGVGPTVALSDVTLLPVIPDPAKILCIGLNYANHVAETKRSDAQYPTVFVRFADSQVGHLQPIVRPVGCEHFDYEGELAIVIGRGGRNIAEAEALGHIAGYACYNDGSARDWQRHTSQFTPGKTFPGTGGFGPALVTPDEIGDYRDLPIATRLNGEVMQQASLADLIFPIPRLIAYCSAFTPLSPGDVIVTGTPGGVGDRRDPPVYLKPGDTVEVDIGAVGVLSNQVVDAL
ncbi:MAG: 5-carboxymethyl-2-hydroxymuconate isomerase [Rhodobacteraceae bacterium]|nr:5-carboxymethyl-2-hydroxymuconate isomerase [Paracoccaceae bacterium]